MTQGQRGDLRPRDSTREESGAVAVVVALTLSVLIFMAAFVLDLGLLRVDTGRSQLAADMAASAGANVLDVLGEDWNALQACETALSYAETNLGAPAGSATATGQTCSERFGSLLSCSVESPASVVYEVGRFSIEITLPVQDSSSLMGSQAFLESYDGEPCERVGVRIAADRDYLLAGIAGSEFQRGRSVTSAVGRAYAAGFDEALASLIVLHPNQVANNQCNFLSVTSQNTSVQVGSFTAIEDGQEVIYPGVITAYAVPDAGACDGQNQQVFSLESSGGGGNPPEILAQGLILSFGLQSGASRDQIYNESYADAPLGSPRISPRPRPGPPTKRSTIDHVYNCMADYPNGPSWSPGTHSLPYDTCAEGTANYIQALHSSYQSLDAGTASDQGFAVFPNDWPTGVKQCNDAQLLAGELPPDFEASGKDSAKWFINCPGSGNQRFSPSGFSLEDVDRVVLSGGVRMTAGSSALSIDGGDNGATVYVQSGDIVRNSGNLILSSLSVYLEDGVLDLGGSSGTVELRALEEPAEAVRECSGYVSGAPPPDCFSRLALWSNRAGFGQNDINVLGGGSSLFVQGILFSPNNAMSLRGSGDAAAIECNPSVEVPSTAKLNLRDAQIWSSRITASGNGVVTLCPSPAFAEPIDIPGSSLIRGRS